MELKELLEKIEKSIDSFLEKVAEKEKKEWEMDERINRLEEIVLGKVKDFWLIKDRFRGLENWLRIEGKEISSGSINKAQLQRIIQYVERMRLYMELTEKGLYQEAKRILWQANFFVRENLRKRGWEYTPLGVVDFVQLDESLLRLKEEIKSLDRDGTDLKSRYQRILSYQLDLMDYFYKPKDHLLSILDYQLKNLTLRFSKEDEFFSASLIYFLRQNRYKVDPYLERFRKALKKGSGLNNLS